MIPRRFFVRTSARTATPSPGACLSRSSVPRPPGTRGSTRWRGGVRYNSRMAVFEPLFKALNDGGVRYVVVGGLAVVLHGYPRMTVDVDLVVDLDEDQATKAIDVLVATGLHARIPVNPRDFANRSVREGWMRQRGMQVFSMFDPLNPMRAVDLFVSYPVPFEDLWSRSEAFDLRGIKVRVASISDLITMKRLAGRVQDLADIEKLKAIMRAKKKLKDG